jgi:Zn-finger nucleic acid-binding protein
VDESAPGSVFFCALEQLTERMPGASNDACALCSPPLAALVAAAPAGIRVRSWHQPSSSSALKIRVPVADEIPVSSELPAPRCPQCGAELKLGTSGQLDAWSCPVGHGLGFTLSEAYERLEDDEIAKIWHASEQAAPGKYACPMCSRPMVNVTVNVGGDGSPQESLDVCRDDEFIWFDPGELDELPQGAPAAQPSADELQKIDQIRKTFDHDLDEADAAEESSGVMNRFASHVVACHPGFVRFLDHAVYRHELDDMDETDQPDAHAA